MKARPSSDASASPARLPRVDLGPRCANSPACSQVPVVGSRFCERCGMRERFRETGDPNVLPNRGACNGDESGMLCTPGRHAKHCPNWKDPNAPPARSLSPHEAELEAKLRDAKAAADQGGDRSVE